MEGNGKMRKGKRRTDKVVGGEMSLTEVGRLAIDKNCFRWAVKDATSYEILPVRVKMWA